MSDAEAKLHKLKVTELKELLAKHHLVQSGKKDELVKRLMDNNISPDGDSEELVEPPTDDVAPPKPASTSAKPQSSAKPPSKSAAPASSSATAPSTSAEPKELTEEQKAMKARAERFGIPFNPNPTPAARTAKATPPSSTPGAGKPAAPSAAAADTAPKEAPKDAAAPKKGIDKAPLGISQEVLAARAAKFGLPEKKETPPAAAAPAAAAKAEKPASKPASKPAEAKKAAEITPEMAARQAEEEEKKRKRAEKFGTGAASATNGSSAPDSKKAKV